MDKLNHCLRSWRTKLKAKKYTAPKRKNVPVEDLIKQPDYRVDPDQWKGMVKKWESPEGQVYHKNVLNYIYVYLFFLLHICSILRYHLMDMNL